MFVCVLACSFSVLWALGLLCRSVFTISFSIVFSVHFHFIYLLCAIKGIIFVFFYIGPSRRQMHHLKVIKSLVNGSFYSFWSWFFLCSFRPFLFAPRRYFLVHSQNVFVKLFVFISIIMNYGEKFTITHTANYIHLKARPTKIVCSVYFGRITIIIQIEMMSSLSFNVRRYYFIGRNWRMVIKSRQQTTIINAITTRVFGPLFSSDCLC